MPVEGAATRLATPALLGAETADALAASRPAALRAAFSLANLAPPRADLVRFLAEAGATGLNRLPGSGAAGGAELARPGPAPGLAAAAAGLSPTDALRPGAVGTGAPVDSDATLPALVSPATVRAGAALALGLGATPPSSAGLPGAGGPLSAEAGAETAPRPGLATASPSGAAPAPVAAAPSAGPAAATIGADAAGAVPGGQNAVTQATGDTGRLVTAAQIAFAEAAIALIDAAASGRSGSVASGVIFNAAMIPGWPFPSAFAKDAPEGMNPKALLHRLATAVEGMSPQEAAEYLAQIGGGHLILRNLRRILMELDRIDKDEVKGLLFSFLETLSAIATGLQTAFKLMAESAALQAAVAHGEVPEDDGRPGRRRLRL
jgi:hypothetical protein